MANTKQAAAAAVANTRAVAAAGKSKAKAQAPELGMIKLVLSQAATLENGEWTTVGALGFDSSCQLDRRSHASSSHPLRTHPRKRPHDATAKTLVFYFVVYTYLTKLLRHVKVYGVTTSVYQLYTALSRVSPPPCYEPDLCRISRLTMIHLSLCSGS